MESASWKALLQSVPLVDIVNGQDIDFGEHLASFCQELRLYDWPRNSRPLQIGQALGKCGGSAISVSCQNFSAAYSLSEHSLSSSTQLQEPRSDELLVWLLIHTQNDEIRQVALYWLTVLSSSRLACRHIESGAAFIACLKKNIGTLGAAYGSHYPAFHCSCQRKLGCAESGSSSSSSSEDKGQAEVCSTPVSTLSHKSSDTLSLGDSESTVIQTEANDSPAFARSNSSGDPPMSLHLPPNADQAHPEALLQSLEDQIKCLEINFCDELFRCMQNMYGWSIFTLCRYYELCSLWHSKIDANRSSRRSSAGAPGSNSDACENVYTKAPIRRSASESANSDGSSYDGSNVRRKDVLASVFSILKCTTPLINTMIQLAPRDRFKKVMEADIVSEFSDALATLRTYSKAPTSLLSNIPESGSRQSATGGRRSPIAARSAEFRRLLCTELRKALLNICGSAVDVYGIAWVDGLAVSLVEALGYEVEIELLWLRNRWFALEDLHRLYDYAFEIHESVRTVNRITEVFRRYAPPSCSDCAPWVENVLTRIHEYQKISAVKMHQLKSPLLDTVDQCDPTMPERIKGLASVACEFTSMQRSRSIYWVHIHPLISHLIEPNVSTSRSLKPPQYSNVQRCVSIPFSIHPRHLPVFRDIMKELLSKYNAGPPDFCEAYADCILYSVFHEHSVPEEYFVKPDGNSLRRSRLYMAWEQFNEYILFHENCIPTRYMLEDKPEHYAREYLRHIGVHPDDLVVLRKLSKSPKFVQALSQPVKTVIELV